MALLYTGFSYGQKNNEEANKKPDLLMVPQKTVTAEAQARDLAKQGWKSSQYTIEAQLSYTNALKCAIDTTSGEPAYLWIQSEISAPSLMDAKKKAFEFCREKLNMMNVKSYFFVQSYFKDPDVLVAAIKKYHEMSKTRKGEYTLLDLLK